MLSRAIFLGATFLLAVVTVASSASAQVLLSGLTRTERGRVTPGGVCVLKALLTNIGNDVWDGVLVSKIQGVNNYESVRHVSVEGKLEGSVEIPIELPDRIVGDYVVFEVALQQRSPDGSRVIVAHKGKPMIETLRLGVSKSVTQSSLALEPDPPEYHEWYWPPQPKFTNPSYELAMACKIDLGYSRDSINFGIHGLPLDQSEWKNMDLLLLSDPNILREAASVDALREYITGGGRVWVMLDRVPSDLLRPLMDAHQACETIDSVDLKSFVVDTYQSVEFPEETRRVDLAEPTVMKRVVQQGGEVQYSVDGWPICISMPIGYGELLITTLPSSAWLEPRDPSTAPANGVTSPYTLRKWCKDLAFMAHAGRNRPALATQLDYPIQRLGAPVVPKSWIVGALSAFCLTLVGLGAWKAMSGSLASLGYWVPLVAFGIGGLLLVAKQLTSADVVESVAQFQLVDCASDGNSARVYEQSAVFTNSSKNMSLDFGSDGVAKSELVQTSGIEQFERYDFQDWKVHNGAWPTGVWRYTTNYALDVDALVAHGTLTEKGCEFELPGSDFKLEDSVLVFQNGSPMLGRTDGSKVLVDGSIKIGKEKWIQSSLITEEQLRRLNVYQLLLGDDKEASTNGLARSRRLYGWSTLVEGPAWNRELKRDGSSLFSMPVMLNRPAPGSKILIPFGLIDLKQSPDQVGKSTAYVDRSGVWRDEVTGPMDRIFRFELPKEVTPLRVQSIRLEMDLQAPQRVVTVAFRKDGKEREVAKLNSPSLPWTFELNGSPGSSNNSDSTDNNKLSDQEILQSAIDGTFEVRIQVSDRSSNDSKVVAWRIKHLHATVQGVVADE